MCKIIKRKSGFELSQPVKAENLHINSNFKEKLLSILRELFDYVQGKRLTSTVIGTTMIKTDVIDRNFSPPFAWQKGACLPDTKISDV